MPLLLFYLPMIVWTGMVSAVQDESDAVVHPRARKRRLRHATARALPRPKR